MSSADEKEGATTRMTEPDGSGQRTRRTTGTGPTEPSRIRLGQSEPAGRYEEREVLGTGGMGEVWSCRDHRLGRLIALKQLRPDLPNDPELSARFLREAQVQGQLEHPAVVPLYDLGSRDGTPYFTMKRVRGVTLHEVLQGLAAGQQPMHERFGRHKLLVAFSAAAQAVHYGHVRGVVHRDLKPHNIMLGDFGEVYVLDWGIAKVIGAEDDEPVAIEDDGLETTTTGEVLGTAGYMAPEQLGGLRAEVDERSDVYCLGAILYEILTLQRLNPGASREDRKTATLQQRDVMSAALDANPGLPPELVAICHRATRLAPAERYAGVDQLLDDLDRFLEGDRDAERRRSLSQQHTASAAGLAERALGAADLSDRGQALSELGHALALDPDNGEARQLLLQLLTEPPPTLPPEVVHRMDREEAQSVRTVARTATIGFAALLLFVPLALWMGVRSWPAIIALTGMVLVCVAALWAVGQLWPATEGGLVPAYLTSSLMLAALSCLFGPLLVVPGLATLNVMVFMINFRRWRWWPVLVACAAVLGPAALQLAGVLRRTYAFDHGTMQVLPWAVSLPEGATLAFLLASAVAVILSGATAIASFRTTLTDAREQLHLHTWQLQQLLPTKTRQAGG